MCTMFQSAGTSIVSSPSVKYALNASTLAIESLWLPTALFEVTCESPGMHEVMALMNEDPILYNMK